MKRERVISVRLSEVEYQLLVDRARKAKKQISTYLREAIAVDPAMQIDSTPYWYSPTTPLTLSTTPTITTWFNLSNNAAG